MIRKQPNFHSIMPAELPSFVQLPHIEGAKSSEPSDLQAAPAERKRGRPHSPESRAKMSEAHKGKQLSPEHRDAMRKGWERRKQHQADQSKQIFPPNDEQQ